MRRRESKWDGLIFRPILLKDLDKVKYLHTIFFPVQYGAKFYQSLLKEDVFITLLAVTSTDEDVVGLITARVECGESLLSEILGIDWCNSNKEGYISTLGVVETYRRTGLGSYLLEQMIHLLENTGCESIALHVKSDNSAALQFYLRNGFQQKRLLREYYLINGKYYDSYKMEKRLSNTSSSSWIPCMNWFSSLGNSKPLPYTHKVTSV